MKRLNLLSRRLKALFLLLLLLLWVSNIVFASFTMAVSNDLPIGVQVWLYGTNASGHYNSITLEPTPPQSFVILQTQTLGFVYTNTNITVVGYAIGDTNNSFPPFLTPAVSGQATNVSALLSNSVGVAAIPITQTSTNPFVLPATNN